MKLFLVEAYLPRARADELADTLPRLLRASASTAAGSVQYLRSTFVPEDEVCFHWFEAESVEAVSEVGERASLAFNRITEATEAAAP